MSHAILVIALTVGALGMLLLLGACMFMMGVFVLGLSDWERWSDRMTRAVALGFFMAMLAMALVGLSLGLKVLL